MREPLDQSVIDASLVTSGGPWRGVELHESIGSTNDRAVALVREQPQGYAAGLAAADGALWRVVLTDDQTGGRGRLGRAWSVPPRASVAVSAVVPAPAESAMGWVPLAAGVALARAMAAVTEAAGVPVEAALKWPNDVLLPADGDRKVAGILCELAIGPSGERAVVVGAGVNVDQSRDELPVDTATSLRLVGAAVRREDLVVAYLGELADLLTTDPVFRAGAGAGVGVAAVRGFGADAAARGAGAGLREEYAERCATLGADVDVHVPGGDVVRGRAIRVDTSGALVVAVGGPGGREQSYAAGDVVHVRRGV